MTDDYEIDPEANYQTEYYEEQMPHIEKAWARRQAKLAAQANQQFMNHTWAEALHEAGLTPEEYNYLTALDPNAAGQAIREGMKHVAKKVGAKRPRDAQGRFTSQPQQPQQPPQERQAGPQERQGPMDGSDQGVDRALKSIFPDDDGFLSYD
jgi:hypothetical protein